MKTPNSKSRNTTSSIKPFKTEVIVGGFVNFLRDHSVVTLAVGFVIATQVQGLVKQLVNSFITPTIQYFFKNALVKDNLIIHLSNRTIVYGWGQFLNEVIIFLFVLVTIYLIIRVLRLDKFTVTKK